MFNRQRVMLAGVVMLLVSAYPTVRGMIFAFNQVSAGADRTDVETQLADSVGFAMSPIFIATALLGAMLIIASLFLAKKQ